ncbi:RmlC-like cupin domain-containing protein [Mycena crocata]|nr:RmlC-like cupin domain-containing protein [Mycena crocata]
MRAYYFDNLPGDQRLPHDYSPSRPVAPETLAALKVSSWTIPVEGYEPRVDEIARERGYKNRDVINVSKEGMGEIYEEKIKGFFQEHMHEDEEIRYILSGSGFFDLRETPTDEWIRISVTPGDLLANDIRALRLFQDEPKWVPYNRGADTEVNTHRVEYLRSVGVGA